MNAKRGKFTAGFTLVEVMIAAVVLAVVATGALSYEYHAVKHSKIARAQICATRTAQLLLEDWMSTGGSSEYDPTMLGLGFSSDGDAYAITVDGVPMLVALTWKDVAHDATAEVTLRELSVTVGFETVSEAGSADGLERIPPVILTTYVRTDASSG